MRYEAQSDVCISYILDVSNTNREGQKSCKRRRAWWQAGLFFTPWVALA